jgi:transcriptional regulator with PAS, ATPase and Fis domain
MADKEKAEFRKDLLYRINTVEIQIPSLKDRKEDIGILVEHYLDIYSKKYGKTGLKIDSSLLRKIENYAWPGNVRELQHSIEKAVILSEGKKIDDPLIFIHKDSQVTNENESGTLEDMEKIMIEKSIDRNRGNLSKVAGELGITRATLYRKMEKFGI